MTPQQKETFQHLAQQASSAWREGETHMGAVLLSISEKLTDFIAADDIERASPERLLKSHMVQADAIKKLLDVHAPETIGNLAARVAQVLTLCALHTGRSASATSSTSTSRSPYLPHTPLVASDANSNSSPTPTLIARLTEHERASPSNAPAHKAHNEVTGEVDRIKQALAQVFGWDDVPVTAAAPAVPTAPTVPTVPTAPTVTASGHVPQPGNTATHLD